MRWGWGSLGGAGGKEVFEMGSGRVGGSDGNSNVVDQ